MMCSALQVARSGFYDWLRRHDAPQTPNEQKRDERQKLVETVFKDNKCIYGYRKVHAVLRQSGRPYSLNTIHADCKRLGIKSITKKKHRVRTTDSNHANPIAENVLSRDFKAEKGTSVVGLSNAKRTGERTVYR